ncbi:MAG: hypothetical protein JXN60_03895 [Lentisphaerae bacterium]|nr:hypothetical protein [Lentisphaerota bacterium]
MGKLKKNRRLPIHTACMLLFYASLVAGAENTQWHVQDAPLRFRVSHTQKPSVDSAGYFVTIPDGGILPGPAPISVVIDASGREIDSYCLYQNRTYGFVVLYGKPTDGDVLIYIKGGNQPNIFPTDSDLTPSVLCYIQTGRASTAAAKQIQMGPAKNSTQFRRHFVAKDDPMAISSDLTRQLKEYDGQPYAARLSGYFVTRNPGRTWIAPIVFQGKNQAEAKADIVEVFIDGNRITPRKESPKSGGTGAWIELKSGLHKLDIYHANDPRSEFSNFLLALRTPNTSDAELGGTRPDDLSMAGTAMWAARRFRNDEIVRSGAGKVKSIESRDGKPTACFTARAKEVLWFGDDKPYLIYELAAMKDGNPKNTKYIWQLSDNATIEDDVITWLLPWFRETAISLTAFEGNAKSVCTVPVFAFEEGLFSDLNNSSTQETFRNAYFNMLRAFPSDGNPTATWSPRTWQTFLDLLEPGTSKLILAEIFGTRKWEAMKKALDPERMRIIEDVFYQWFSYKSPEKCLTWLDQVRKAEKSAERRKELDLMKAEVLMYRFDNLKEARSMLLRSISGLGRLANLARIRLGDVEFLAGDYNKAVELYGQVQDRVKHSEIVRNGSGSVSPNPARISLRGGHITPDWRIGAVRETAGAETIRKLIDEGYMREAFVALQTWEQEFPLTKIAGNYIVTEAKFYMKIGDYARARKALEAYAKAVDMTNDLPDAFRMIADCMIKMNEPMQKLDELVKEAEKRLPNHTVIPELRAAAKRK